MRSHLQRGGGERWCDMQPRCQYLDSMQEAKYRHPESVPRPREVRRTERFQDVHISFTRIRTCFDSCKGCGRIDMDAKSPSEARCRLLLSAGPTSKKDYRQAASALCATLARLGCGERPSRRKQRRTSSESDLSPSRPRTFSGAAVDPSDKAKYWHFWPVSVLRSRPLPPIKRRAVHAAPVSDRGAYSAVRRRHARAARGQQGECPS
ncbi:hypothetical protein BCR34DRAFT_29821 [Clohesyomyces aquaticus]|uniref:Uncharacterized protein n=1 Tax=Clohesyomyces aquaticus TaxID=1231657 RepID=A0A1Y1ZB76_9PLEO|nr:hypothetical protein BCR34DRAFT_29821 [Clohesyomyces aquaticus]